MSAKNFKNCCNIKFLKIGVIWGKNRNSHREYALVSLFSLGINGCRGSNRILSYQEYAVVSWVCIGNFGILNLVSLVFFGIKRLDWYSSKSW